MNIIPVQKIYGCDFSVEVMNGLKQYWEDPHFYSCIGSPTAANLFLYVDGCELEYTLKNGEKIYAPDKSLVYLPRDCEYELSLSNVTNEKSLTVGIRFFLFDKNGEEFILSDTIIPFTGIDFSYEVFKIFSSGEGAQPFYSKMKSNFYAMITRLCENMEIDRKYKIIEEGIKYLQSEIKYELSLSEIAKMCNVSEIYFRRLFKEYSGISPVKYRIKNRIDKARKYLLYDDLTVFEIADILGFNDTSYFCKQFKDFEGVSPMEFKKNRM